MINNKGSITVFLTLVGLLIFALLGTLIETARFTACKDYSTRSLRMATEGLMTEYSLPLYKNYSLFFIEQEGKPYQEVISEYVSDTFTAVKPGYMDMFKGELTNVKIKNKQCLGDNKAEGFQKEINSYMKRKLAKDAFSKFLSKKKDFEKSEKSAKEIDEMADEEKELAKYDKEYIGLIKLIDGISVNKAKIYCEEYFVKMFAVSKIIADEFGITEAKVFSKMKGKIDDTPASFSKLNKSKFKLQVTRVLEITKQAISQASSLSNKVDGFVKKGKNYKDHQANLRERLRAIKRVLPGNKKILERTLELLQGDINEEKKEELFIIWKDYDTKSISFDYTGIDNSKEVDSPLDFFSDAWGSGILKLVCPKSKKISDKSISNPDRFADYYKEKCEDFKTYDSKVSDVSSKQEVKISGTMAGVKKYAEDEFMLDSYISDKFFSYTNSKKFDWKRALNYQMEYIVGGENSDKRNLEAVLNRILLIRTPINFMAIYSDTAKKAEAYATALALVGFTCLIPLIKFMQILILVIWAFVESLVDISGLLQEKNVPVIKTAANVKTSYMQLFQINNTSICARAKKFGKANGKSIGYKEYLMMFLAASKQTTRRYRALDLIDQDMKKNGYANIDLIRCVFAMDVDASFTFQARFFRYSIIERMLGRQWKEYNIRSVVHKSYV